MFMKTTVKRSTVYFDPDLYRALKIKAAKSDRSLSALINQAVQYSLAEDAEDLAAFTERNHEPNLDFEKVLNDLKSLGKI
jgi:predicted transcriptional regulator